jgi:hypothetical protein
MISRRSWCIDWDSNLTFSSLRQRLGPLYDKDRILLYMSDVGQTGSDVSREVLAKVKLIMIATDQLNKINIIVFYFVTSSTRLFSTIQ